MSQVCFSCQPHSPSQLLNNDAEQIDLFCAANQMRPDDILVRGRAYALTSGVDLADILNVLNHQSASERHATIQVVNSLGEEAHVLAAFADKHLSREKLSIYNNLVGAGITAATTRLDGFGKSLVVYQNALLDLRSLQQSTGGRPAHARKLAAQRAVKNAYQLLQEQYLTELRRFAPEYYRAKNVGSALNNADRGITLAERRPRSPKTDPRLLVADKVQASRLAMLGRLLNKAGHGAIGLDAALRVQEINAVHREGGDWMRESSRQMTGFGLGGALGFSAGRAAMTGGAYFAAKAGLLVAGPLGWAVLGVVVLGSLGAGYMVGKYADQTGKWVADSIWDL